MVYSIKCTNWDCHLQKVKTQGGAGKLLTSGSLCNLCIWNHLYPNLFAIVEQGIVFVQLTAQIPWSSEDLVDLKQ